MNTSYATLQHALSELHKLNTGTVVDINGRKLEVVRVNRCTTFRTMDAQPQQVKRPDDGRQFMKVHMSNHKIAQAIVGG